MYFLGLLLLFSQIYQALNQDPPQFKTGIEMVRLQISVTEKNKSMNNLKKEDFVIYEDGRAQDIAIFHQESPPIALTLLIDASGSMAIRQPTGQIAALNLISQLRPNDKIRVIQFHSHTNLIQNFTTNHRLAAQAINKIEVYGGTAIYDAVYATLGANLNSEAEVNILILLTDGKDNFSINNYSTVVDFAKQNDTIIYVIKLGSLKISEQDKSFLEAVSRETGGQIYPINNLKQLSNAYDKIGLDIQGQYTIGYTSNNTSSIGSWRKILVTVRKHPKLKIRHRSGYYAIN